MLMLFCFETETPQQKKSFGTFYPRIRSGRDEPNIAVPLLELLPTSQPLMYLQVSAGAVLVQYQRSWLYEVFETMAHEMRVQSN